MTFFDRLLRALTPPPEQPSVRDSVEDADARLNEALEIGRAQLEEQKAITRELAAIRRRMGEGQFPILGDEPPNRGGR